ncbi:unnamed protein product [Schistosoma mattheei]|uniref:Uncharacterized protein n=1 Tax=Schistosoma mattheei TaxID=31246 RepID=A0A183PVZ1_9TREM|nr:unnamed protein product [Schistosoma mattheei]
MDRHLHQQLLIVVYSYYSSLMDIHNVLNIDTYVYTYHLQMVHLHILQVHIHLNYI